MSANFYMTCEETKLAIWIGQGWAGLGMECFYSGEDDTMEAFHKFLKEHENKNLVLRHEFHVVGHGFTDYITKEVLQ